MKPLKFGALLGTLLVSALSLSPMTNAQSTNGYPWPDNPQSRSQSQSQPQSKTQAVHGAPRTFIANHGAAMDCPLGSDRWAVYIYYRSIYGDVRLYEESLCSQEQAKTYMTMIEHDGFTMNIPLTPHIAHGAMLRVELLDEND